MTDFKVGDRVAYGVDPKRNYMPAEDMIGQTGTVTRVFDPDSMLLLVRFDNGEEHDLDRRNFTQLAAVEASVSKEALGKFLADNNTSLDRSYLIGELMVEFGITLPTTKFTVTVEVELPYGHSEDPEDIINKAFRDPDAVINVNKEEVR